MISLMPGRSMNCRQCFSRFARAVSACAILALPIGIDSRQEDISDYSFGVYGGGGQYMSVLKSCEGNDDSVANKFAEGSATFSMRIPPRSRSPYVLGIRGGLWQSDITYAGASFNPVSLEYEREHIGTATYGYLSPSISDEGVSQGIGIGVLLGRYPGRFSPKFARTPRMTGHVRLGRTDRFHVIFDLNESMPLNSGGGSVSLGAAFPLGKQCFAYSGLAFGGFYYAGFSHQVRLAVGRGTAVDLGLRWTPFAEYGNELGVSAGIQKTIGKVRSPESEW